MSALTFRRPATTVLAAAADAAEKLVHEYAARATRGRQYDPQAYWLAGVAVADSVGLDPSRWVAAARAAGASWQQLAVALGSTKGAVHSKFRHLDLEA